MDLSEHRRRARNRRRMDKLCAPKITAAFRLIWERDIHDIPGYHMFTLY
jgi:hypothetical protein